VLHGRDLLVQGFTLEQVVRDYGDVCQAVTNLAFETNASIEVEEFRTFNRCLDDAIAGAVTKYAQHSAVSVENVAQSKITAQGQISVPAEVRKKLGVGPGSILEWDEHNDGVLVRRAGRYSSADVHAALFPEKMPKKGRADVKNGIRRYIRDKHARG
jgi:AbrB family looped-hinge helix DNA binding protein